MKVALAGSIYHSQGWGSKERRLKLLKLSALQSSTSGIWEGSSAQLGSSLREQRGAREDRNWDFGGGDAGHLELVSLRLGEGPPRAGTYSLEKGVLAGATGRNCCFEVKEHCWVMFMRVGRPQEATKNKDEEASLFSLLQPCGVPLAPPCLLAKSNLEQLVMQK